MNLIRRDFLKTTGALAAGGAAGCSRPGAGPDPSNIMFAVAPSFIPVHESEKLFQVRRIYCVGHNYAAHAREMGGDPTREDPFFFQKPTDAVQLVPPGATVDHVYPPVTKNYHHEVELVAAIGRRGRNIPAGNALDFVVGYGVGLDMTRRDLQKAMGEMKRPWEVGKSFDHAAVVSHLQPVEKVGHPKQGSIWLKVNNQVRQSADLKQMIWAVNEQISHLSQYYELFPGDIIYSGTPENVGPVVPGDIMDAHIDGLYDIRVKVVS
jgi:fumarylpyruvate hydrolase